MSDLRNEFVSWSFSVPQELREAIIKQYVPSSEKSTDKRYYKEFSEINKVPYATVDSDRLNLVSALKAYEIKIESVKMAGEFHQQGQGNYWVIGLEQTRGDYATTLFVSEIGKFIAFDIIWLELDSWEEHAKNIGVEALNIIRQCKEIAVNLGFYCIEPNLLTKIVPKLYVRSFGRTAEQTIGSLTFYWED